METVAVRISTLESAPYISGVITAMMQLGYKLEGIGTHTNLSGGFSYEYHFTL